MKQAKEMGAFSAKLTSQWFLEMSRFFPVVMIAKEDGMYAEGNPSSSNSSYRVFALSTLSICDNEMKRQAIET